MKIRKPALSILVALFAASTSLCDIMATRNYCDHNRMLAISNSEAHVNAVITGIVEGVIGDIYNPSVITQTVMRITNTVTYVDNVISNYWSTNYVDNVISNYYTVEHNTNYIDNVISNYYTVEYSTNYVDNIISNYFIVEYHTNYVDNVISNFWSTNEHYETYNTYTTNWQNGATFLLVDTNEVQGISGDLNVYSISRKSQRDSVGGYWLQMIDLYTGDIFVYESTYSSSPYKYFRYRRLDGPTITTGSGASLRYLGGIVARFPYTFSASSTSAICTLRVYDDSGTLKEESSSFNFTVINNGGYYIVGGRKMAILTEYVMNSQIDRLVTTNMLADLIGGSSTSSTTNKVTRLYKYDGEIKTVRYDLNATEYTYGGTYGGSASYTTKSYGYTFLVCNTNYIDTTISGTRTIRYPAYGFQHKSGYTAASISASYNWIPSTSKGGFSVNLNSTSVDQTSNPLYTPEYVFTNTDMSIGFNNTSGETMPEYDYDEIGISFSTNIVDSSNQYINGGLGVFDLSDNRIATLATVKDVSDMYIAITNWVNTNFQRKP